MGLRTLLTTATIALLPVTAQAQENNECTPITETPAVQQLFTGRIYALEETRAKQTHKWKPRIYLIPNAEETINTIEKKLVAQGSHTPKNYQTAGLQAQQRIQRYLNTTPTTPPIIKGSIHIYNTYINSKPSSDLQKILFGVKLLEGHLRGFHHQGTIYLASTTNEDLNWEEANEKEVLYHERGHEILTGFLETNNLECPPKNCKLLHEGAAQYLGQLMKRSEENPLPLEVHNSNIRQSFINRLPRGLPRATRELSTYETDGNYHFINHYMLAPIHLSTLVEEHSLAEALKKFFSEDLCVHRHEKVSL